MFLRRSPVGTEPLPVAMSGVRIGERLLQVGIDDPVMAGALSAKVGMSGSAAHVVADEREAHKARTGASKAGALVDVCVAPFDDLPFAEHAFDLIVVNGMHGQLASLDAAARDRALRECRRVLRTGGRVVTVETGTRSGLGALLRPSADRESPYARLGGAEGALRAAGFAPVRALADREGYAFVEGLRPAD